MTTSGKRQANSRSATLAIPEVPGNAIGELTLAVHGESEVVSDRMVELGIWEPTETACFCRLLKADDFFVDVGANIGYYTLLAQKLVGEKGEIVALEPDTRNFRLLEHNCKDLGSTKVELLNVAAATGNDGAELFQSSNNFGDHRITSNPELGASAVGNSVAVDTVSLDSLLLARTKKSALVKIDCQGAESTILKGMQKTLANAEMRPTAVITEYWPFVLKQSGSSASEMLDLIPTEEYHIWNIGSWGHKPARTDKQSLLELAAKEKNPESKPYTYFTNLLFLAKECGTSNNNPAENELQHRNLIASIDALCV